jgi:hypothetical protein
MQQPGPASPWPSQQTSDLSGLVLTASLVDQVLGIAVFVGIYLNAAPQDRGTGRLPYQSRARLAPGNDAPGRRDPDDAGMISTGIEVGSVASAVESVPAAQPQGAGGVRVPGFGAAERRFDVRHLVIFRAPVIGYARPATAGAR